MKPTVLVNPYHRYLQGLAEQYGGYSQAAQAFFNLARDIEPDTPELAKGTRTLAADLVAAGNHFQGRRH